MADPKSSGSDREEARAVDYVKTSQEAEAELERKAAEAKAQKGSDREQARAVDYVKTSQGAEAELERKAAEAKAQKATHPSGAAEPDDSPKR
jgi:conjugal transfer/entry exclusion protein